MLRTLLKALAPLAVLALFASPARAATSYWTSCEIEGGKAKGYVHTDGSLSFSGQVYFKMFDERRRLVSEDSELAIVIVVGADTELVEETDAPSNATRCTLDISEAVGHQPNDPSDPNGPNDDPRYTTSCDVVGGKAKGYVTTTGSLSFSGSVYFKMYDEDWDLVDEDSELAIVIVVGADTEFVEETDAAASVKYCTLDISAAVGH